MGQLHGGNDRRGDADAAGGQSRTWIKKTDYLEREFRPSLHSFATQRTDLLAVLEPLPINAWSRTATVTGAGRVLERTVLFYGQWLARHERQHVKQVEHIVSTMFKWSPS